MKPMTKTQLIEVAKKDVQECARVLAVRDKEWRAEWDEAPNPFAAVAQYKCEHQKAVRAAVIGPWLAAQEVLRRLES